MALDVESVVHGGVGGEEFLRGAGALEATEPIIKSIRIYK
jgi:hypothetical protein